VSSAASPQAAPQAAPAAANPADTIGSSYAETPSRAVTVTGSANGRRGSKAYKGARVHTVAVTGSGKLVVSIRAWRKPVVNDAQGTKSLSVATSRVGSVWASLGDGPTGVVTGWTQSGRNVSTPVVFTKSQYQKKKKIFRVWATPESGSIPEAVKQYVPNLKDSTARTRKGEYRQVSVTGFSSTSKTWNWSESGSGTVKVDKGTVTVKVHSADALQGVSPGRRHGVAIDPAELASDWAKYTGGGVKPRMVVTGVKEDGTTRSAILTPSSVSFSAGDLVLTAPAEGTPPKGRQKDLFVSVETPGNGVTTRYVVITGDSIASGEGASFAGTYLNPNLMVTPTSDNDDEKATPAPLLTLLAKTGEQNNPDPKGVMARAMVEFCKKVDLACTKAEINADGKVVYERDPGKVYEKGSWEKADTGEACHRSKTAPGTWLARYYKVQSGLDVESINIACSGATTDNILTETFKGERPQVQDLQDLADWLPVEYVVNTVGANDIDFQGLATKCFFAPITAILGEDGLSGGGGSLNATTLLGSIVKIFDDVVRAPDGSLVSVNPRVDVQNLCSETERENVKRSIENVRGKIGAALRGLHDAAPDAHIVQTNYPSLVPASTNTYWPRAEYFAASRDGLLSNAAGYWDVLGKCGDALKKPFGQALSFLEWCRLPESRRNEITAQFYTYLKNGEETFKFPDAPPATSGLWPGGKLPDGAPNPDPVQGAIEGNKWNSLIMDNYYSFNSSGATQGQTNVASIGIQEIIQLWIFQQSQVLAFLNYGAALFGADQDWAAKEVIVGLNRAVDDAARDVDPAGDFITSVDMTQVFNGREFGGKFVGHERSPHAEVLGYNDASRPDGDQWANGSPTKSRAQFVTTIFAGQELPLLCPGGTDAFDMAVTDSSHTAVDVVAGDPKPRCIGDFQENLHPNWRGQAAQGQCIVAVVTRAYGQGGNACVRSIGSDNGALERTYSSTGTLDDAKKVAAQPILFSKVNGDDGLCLTGIEDSLNASAKGNHLGCTTPAKDSPADPAWDKDTWAAGSVKDSDGTPVHWR
jgi:hypothetical protein